MSASKGPSSKVALKRVAKRLSSTVMRLPEVEVG